MNGKKSMLANLIIEQEGSPRFLSLRVEIECQLPLRRLDVYVERQENGELTSIK